MKSISINKKIVVTSLGSVAFFCGGLGISADKAEAALITYGTNVFTNVTAPANTSFQLPTFDTSLGTLTSVTISSTLTGSAVISIFNVTSSSQVFTNASASVPLTISTSAPSSLTTTATNSTASGVAAPGQTNLPGLPITITGNENIASSNWGFFQSAGPASFTASADLGAGTYGGTSNPGVFFGGTSNISADVSITYEYTPIPEPMTILGSIGALGFMGSLNRRFAKDKNKN